MKSFSSGDKLMRRNSFAVFRVAGFYDLSVFSAAYHVFKTIQLEFPFSFCALWQLDICSQKLERLARRKT